MSPSASRSPGRRSEGRRPPEERKDKKRVKSKQERKRRGDDLDCSADKRRRDDTRDGRPGSSSLAGTPSEMKKRRDESPPPWAAAGNLAEWTLPPPTCVQLNPTLCTMYGCAGIAPEACAREANRLGGMQNFIKTLDCMASEHLSTEEPWVAGARWSMAYIVQEASGDGFDALWTKFKETLRQHEHPGK